MDDFTPTSFTLSPGWVDFFIVFGSIITVALLWLVLFLSFGKRRKRQHHHRHHRRERRAAANPTLAQTGGLPPKRDENQPPKRDAT